jgi:hypothetical protein
MLTHESKAEVVASVFGGLLGGQTLQEDTFHVECQASVSPVLQHRRFFLYQAKLKWRSELLLDPCSIQPWTGNGFAYGVRIQLEHITY